LLFQIFSVQKHSIRYYEKTKILQIIIQEVIISNDSHKLDAGFFDTDSVSYDGYKSLDSTTDQIIMQFLILVLENIFIALLKRDEMKTVSLHYPIGSKDQEE